MQELALFNSSDGCYWPKSNSPARSPPPLPHQPWSASSTYNTAFVHSVEHTEKMGFLSFSRMHCCNKISPIYVQSNWWSIFFLIFFLFFFYLKKCNCVQPHEWSSSRRVYSRITSAAQIEVFPKGLGLPLCFPLLPLLVASLAHTCSTIMLTAHFSQKG